MHIGIVQSPRGTNYHSAYTDFVVTVQVLLDWMGTPPAIFSAGSTKTGSGVYRTCYLTLHKKGRRILDLLMTIGVVLLILWLLGLVTSYTLGGFIHILLVLAIIVILVRVIQGRRPIP